MHRAGTVIYNGFDEGEIGLPDRSGDVVVKYLIAKGETVTTTTQNRVSLIVGQVQGVEFVEVLPNQSGIRKATIYYDYSVENTGNGTDTIKATLSNTPVPIQLTQLVETTSATLIPKEGATFTIEVTIGTCGILSEHTIVITDGEGESIADKNTITLAVPRITLMKKITTEGSYLPGSKVGFRIEYNNEGDVPAYNMEIIDYIHPNIEVDYESIHATGSVGPFEIYIKKGKKRKGGGLIIMCRAKRRSGNVSIDVEPTDYIVILEEELSQCLQYLKNGHYCGTISGVVKRRDGEAVSRKVTLCVINNNREIMVKKSIKVNRVDNDGIFSCDIATKQHDTPPNTPHEVIAW